MQNTFQLRSDSEATALRVFAGNGFGDADIGRTEAHLLFSSLELYHAARVHRSYQLREIVKATAQAAGEFLRRVVAEWERRRCAKATYAALRTLDPRILRDLGFHRSELLSVAAEVAGVARSTRVAVRHSSCA
jgi:uncharacterized protein YjiS (DUF1127 family)